jgi:hypothetical protein
MSADAKKGWQSTRESLRDAFGKMPHDQAKAKTDIKWFWDSCSAALGDIGAGFAKSGPDFLKAMDSIQNGFKQAGDKFKTDESNSPAQP